IGSRLLFRGRPGARRWTRQGATLLYAGPWVVLALVVAGWLPPWAGPPLWPVLGLLGLALVLGLAARPARSGRYSELGSVLAPRLESGGFDLADSAFLAGLARRTLEEGALPPVGPVRDLAEATERAVAARQGPPGHLALLRRLQIEGEVRGGADPVPLVV